MLDNRIDQKLPGLERMLLNERLQVHGGVLELDQRQPQLPLDDPQVVRQLTGRLHAEPDLVRLELYDAEIVAARVGRGHLRQHPLRLVVGLVPVYELLVFGGKADEGEHF